VGHDRPIVAGNCKLTRSCTVLPDDVTDAVLEAGLFAKCGPGSRHAALAPRRTRLRSRARPIQAPGRDAVDPWQSVGCRSMTARYFSSNRSNSGLIRTGGPPKALASSQECITPVFGYGTPHALPGAHYEPIGLAFKPARAEWGYW